MVTTNPNFYGQSNTDTSNQIEDGVDYPHTGLLKALSLGMANTYAISGFNASSVNATAITIAAGVIIRNGEKVAVSGATLSISASHTDVSAGEAGYNLLVAPAGATPTVVIRGSAAANKVPAYTDGDTIIAVLTHTGTNPMHIQYLTLNHKTNSLSIAYNDSGYTEAMSIKGTAAVTTFTNNIADADIRFMLAANTSDEKFEVYEDTGDSEVFSVTGAGVTAVKSLSLGAAGELTITESSDDITFTNTVNDKDIKFVVNDAGGNDSTATLTCATAAFIGGGDDRLVLKGIEEILIIALSDETTNLTTGTDKIIFHMPFAMTLTGVKASVSEAPTGSTIIVDINEFPSGGSKATILSTKLSIDASEMSSLSAASAAVISDAALADNATLHFDIDQIGSSNAGKGLKVTLYGYRT
jgi:hypothetical protein